MKRHFVTALRPYVKTRLEEIGHADIVVGIPSFNNDTTVTHVMRMASRGIRRHYPDARAVIIVSDGGSTDDTREHAQRTVIAPWVERVVNIYRGLPGKGTAFRAIFEAALELRASACVVCDSDLRSITPGWIKNLADPVLRKGFDFVTPVYQRHKYDGTITNNIIYNLTRAIFGKRIRQPIGGDFAMSPAICRHYVDQDVWDTDVAKYGVDIWMTISAVTHGFRVCQTRLGRKIHDVKDPSESLGPMFRQVVGTFFSLMEQYQDYWLDGIRSEELPTFGRAPRGEPEAMTVDLDRLVENYREGLAHFGSLWKEVVAPRNYRVLRSMARMSPGEFAMPLKAWVEILYDFAVAFHSWKRDRMKLINLMTPLYYGRIASFVNETEGMSDLEAEAVVQHQAQAFEHHRDYLVRNWSRVAGGTEV